MMPGAPQPARYVEEMNRFYMCSGKTGWNAKKNCAGSCGLYMPSQYWKRIHRNPSATGQRWHCGIEWEDVAIYEPELYQRVTQNGTVKPPDLGCGARYFPWARGSSMVVEVRDGQKWEAFLADEMPDEMLRLVELHKTRFHESMGKMTPQEFMKLIPVTFPKVHLIEGCIVPWLGRFPKDQYIEEGRPVLDQVGWWKLARAVALGDMSGLYEMFNVASRTLGDYGKVSEEVRADGSVLRTDSDGVRRLVMIDGREYVFDAQGSLLSGPQ
jgi:hypothetical protein